MKRQSQEPEMSPLSLFAEWQEEKKQARKSAARAPSLPLTSITRAPDCSATAAAIATTRTNPDLRMVVYRDGENAPIRCCASGSTRSYSASGATPFTVMVEILGIFEGGKQIA